MVYKQRDYKVLSSASLDELADKVNEALEQGYFLMGGIAVKDSYVTYYQAVCKVERNTGFPEVRHSGEV